MTFQTYSLFVLSIIMIYSGRVENRLNLLQLQDDIDKLKADFNSSRSDVGDGGPIFTGRLSNWTERNEKRIILSQIVSMYLKILKNTDQSKAHVRNISEELYTLQKSLSDDSMKMEYLKNLTELQVNDLKIQRKAVNELFSVLQKLGDTTSSPRRKRRLVQRQCKC
ncbi:interferon gamma [Pseudopipra pipra]|uniref:interferon gamma n=1 Tax=Pseudopipra pipra TaxID=415032 RepID=UPI00313A3105